MTMRLSLSAYKQVQPRVNFQGELRMKPFFRRKDKVVFVLGPTGTGKSRLAIDLATHFQAEVINCDKMQVYKGLDIATNKVTEEECRGVPHHLLGIADPNEDFTSKDFRHHASSAVESIVKRDRLPIIAGGSNSYVEALANDDPEFRLRYECCFLWVDVELPLLESFISDRVDRMVEAGLIDEVRSVFDATNSDDYSQGIKRAIGVPELDQFLRNEMIVDTKTSRELRDKAIEKIKENTCTLAHRQSKKIERLRHIWEWEWKWQVHLIDASPVFLASGKEADNIWDRIVAGRSTEIVNGFLCAENHVSPVVPSEIVNGFLCDENHVSPVVPSEPVNMVPISVPAMAVVAA